MTIRDRIMSWIGRGPSADPADLARHPHEDPAASTGLERPFPEVGPVDEPPTSPTDPDPFDEGDGPEIDELRG